ncbi:MAG TPA: cytochrome c biogenesis protein CcsA [Caldilineae bacterium]|nr:cytochrome c biogenesis protein CcsA [Caldilineae bacterium]
MLIGLAYVALWSAALMYLAYTWMGRLPIGQAATGMAVVAWGLQTAALIRRGLAAGHWPLTNRYEVALSMAWAIVTVYLVLEANWRERRAGAFALGIALLVASYAITRPAADRALAPLLPALRSPWFQVHVLSAVVGYGACGVAAGLGIMRWAWRADEGNLGLSVRAIERQMGRVVGWGFPWLTLGILSGAIWAQGAWGRYWGWDPKETWALITWLWYLMMLHVQTLPRWRGRRLSALTVIGFGIVLFTFVGVPWLVRVVRLESLHGY